MQFFIQRDEERFFLFLASRLQVSSGEFDQRSLAFGQWDKKFNLTPSSSAQNLVFCDVNEVLTAYTIENSEIIDVDKTQVSSHILLSNK